MLDLLVAYIDPGTGSILLQLVLGAVVGAGVFFRGALIRTMNPIRKLLGKKSDD